MNELLTYLVQSIVSHPTEVNISENTLPDGSVALSIKVHPDDMGEVIGKGGKIIKSVRSICKAAAIKAGKRVHVDIIELSEENQPHTSNDKATE